MTFFFTAARVIELWRLKSGDVVIKRDGSVHIHLRNRKNYSVFFFVEKRFWSFFLFESVFGIFLFFLLVFLASSGFPMPPDGNPQLSAGVWYCRYLYFVDQDGVAPGVNDYFFRAFERGKFVRKRLGKKRYSALMKEIAAHSGYDPRGFSG